jgi:hypothetical protein
VLVVHEVVAEARAATGDASIGELDIEAAEGRRYVDYEEAVEEAYRCIPALISTGRHQVVGICHLKAGKRPKKATNVKNETVRATIMRVRASAIVSCYNACMLQFVLW